MSRQSAREDRREFMRRAAAGLGIVPLLPGMAAAADDGRRRPRAEGGVILFQGDSITDAGRNREDQDPNAPPSLGHGYAALAAAEVLGEHPEDGWTIYNRGVSGNKVFQLAERWQEDALDLQPDVLSILIGVNDFWHTLNGGYEGTVETYERDFRALLDRTRESLPEVQLIIGEPFAVEGGTAIDARWDAFKSYPEAARRVAEDYEAEWVPYQEIFDEALEQAPAAYWAPDGVHPSAAGNYIMAQAWLEALNRLLG